LGHLSRDCNTPELAEGAVRALIERNGQVDLEIYGAGQSPISPRFQIGETPGGHFQPTFDSAFFDTTRAASRCAMRRKPIYRQSSKSIMPLLPRAFLPRNSNRSELR